MGVEKEGQGAWWEAASQHGARSAENGVKRGGTIKHSTHHSQEPAETSLPKAPDIWNGSSCWALWDPYLSEATPSIPGRSPPPRRGRHCSIVQFVLSATAGLPGQAHNGCPLPVLSRGSTILFPTQPLAAEPEHRPPKQFPHPVTHVAPGLPPHRRGWSHTVQSNCFCSPYWRTEEGGPAGLLS